jgi:hypothetical protein
MAAMLISGIEVPLAAVAMLALRLHRLRELELSSRIGFAVDMNRAELTLRARDREPLLRALGRGPDELDGLRAALRPDWTRARAGRDGDAVARARRVH